MKALTRRMGVALVLITHNLGVVARYADRVNVMYAGRIVETAATRELFARPRHPYTIGLLGSLPRIDQRRGGRLVPIAGQPPDLARLDGGCSYRPRCRWSRSRAAPTPSRRSRRWRTPIARPAFASTSCERRPRVCVPRLLLIDACP